MEKAENFVNVCLTRYKQLTTEQAIKEGFVTVDANKNGVLEKAELTAVMTKILSLSLGRGPNEEELKKALEETFAKYDTDKNGVIDYEEFKLMFITFCREEIPNSLIRQYKALWKEEYENASKFFDQAIAKLGPEDQELAKTLLCKK